METQRVTLPLGQAQVLEILLPQGTEVNRNENVLRLQHIIPDTATNRDRYQPYFEPVAEGLQVREFMKSPFAGKLELKVESGQELTQG
jgi:hypothetical protein